MSAVGPLSTPGQPTQPALSARGALSSVFELTERPGLYVIAEAGVNHDGSVADAHALVDLAADTGADAIKFQTFDPAALVSATAQTAAYQAASTGVATQRELLERYVLPAGAWPELRDHAIERGVDFLSTAFDLASLDLVCELGVHALKLGSGELTNKPLLTEVARRGLPVLCSTGMGAEAEVGDAVGWLAPAPGLLLMHCVSSYPAPVEQANLRALESMRRRFELPVGWSDHTVGTVAAVASVALGAAALEKHVTLDRSRPGPDHAASADRDGFADYVRQVRDAHAALGDGVKRPVAAEAATTPLVRRSWHAARDLHEGELVGPADVALLRPADGIAPAQDVIGQRLVHSVPQGSPLRADDLDDNRDDALDGALAGPSHD
ncbi:MAG: N-acetylneuraminate synthase family protein [Actinomycetota bacterium]|nr:N-acetylneuraminate synthase family protein [Actinomycetota bacterium]